ncbi:PREDICTED: sorbitol dehydrogenase-like [Ceratosolen solmsi marchali]|uniref:Sorbitol dehydrogenase n=1 Tax=Ceratosolen solmsi marchali TaxID=326594 RepID=A0AAJ7DZS2_9HYME|nr:PREDICTED: sorbitol dehydrogenase-like [Ceratosolen solmsi marchali]
MSTDNLTAILYGINDLRLEQTEIEEPNESEVLLKIACVGICGSDVHYLENGRIGDYVVEQPMIIGHESSGTVIKLGSAVQNLKIGDRVAIEPGVPCRICVFCKRGRYNLCKDIKFCATPPVHGSLRRYYKHAADFCFKLPDNVSFEEGALLEPLSVGVHACKRANVGIGSSVLILGAGPIGLATLLAAKAMEAKLVVISDLIEYRLNIAKKLKADQTYIIDNIFKENENINNIHKLFNGQPDITIDTSGTESSIRLAIMDQYKDLFEKKDTWYIKTLLKSIFITFLKYFSYLIITKVDLLSIFLELDYGHQLPGRRKVWESGRGSA